MWCFRLIASSCLAAALSSGQTTDPAEQAQKASELVAEGKADEAAAIYARLVHDYPGRPELLLNLCIAEFKAKRYEQAITHAKDALKLNPNLAPADLFLGAAYLQSGERALAVEPLQKAVAAMPADHNAHLMLGDALLGSKRLEEALQQFRETSQLLPQSPKAWYGLGEAYDQLFENCRSQLHAIAPDSSYWWALQGDVYLQQEKWDRAISAYREALRRGPAIPGIHAALARAYDRNGHPDSAAKEEASAESAAAAAHSSDAAASCYAKCKAYLEAAAEAYASLAALPPSLESHWHAAKVLDAQGRYRESAAEWRSSMELAPDNIEVEMGLAWSLFRRRDYDSGLTVLKQVLARDPAAAEANFLYGASLLNLEQADAAIPYLQTALKRDPELQVADAALGQALLRTGKPQEAIPYLRAAVPSDEDGNAHFQLFRAYQETGQVQLAKQALAAYQKLRAAASEKRAADDGSPSRASGK
jgi:tetratricopeptide (TPR) repeat protein